MARLKNNKISTPSFAPWLGVFETLKVISGKAMFVKEHADSLRESASALGLKSPTVAALQKTSIPNASGRLRWIVDGAGFRSLFTEEESKRPRSFSLGISEVRLGSKNWDARYKTLSYLTHWQARVELLRDSAVSQGPRRWHLGERIVADQRTWQRVGADGAR